MFELRVIDYAIILMMLCSVICVFMKNEKRVSLFIIIILALFSDATETYFITIVFISALMVDEEFIEHIIASISHDKYYWKYQAIVPVNNDEIQIKIKENAAISEYDVNDKKDYNQYIYYENKSISRLVELLDCYYILRRNVKIELIDGRTYIPDAMISTKDTDYIVEVKTNVNSLHVIERLNNIRISYEKDTGRSCNVIIIYKLISPSIFTKFEKFIYFKFDGENFENINEVCSLIK